MANLRVNLDTAIYSVLNVASVTNEATGGVFNSIAPQGTEPPFVIFQAMSKTDEYWSFSSGRGGAAVYMVKEVTRGPWPKSAGDIDTQIDSVMQDASLSVSGFSLLTCRRQEDVYLIEDDEGVIYQHVGGLYSINADQS